MIATIVAVAVFSALIGFGLGHWTRRAIALEPIADGTGIRMSNIRASGDVTAIVYGPDER